MPQILSQNRDVLDNKGIILVCGAFDWRIFFFKSECFPSLSIFSINSVFSECGREFVRESIMGKREYGEKIQKRVV